MGFDKWVRVMLIAIPCAFVAAWWWKDRKRVLTPREKAEQEQIENDLAQW